MKDNPMPTGELMGDTRPMPDRGTTVGLIGDTYGADLAIDALNSIGSIASACRSDAPNEENVNDADAGRPD